MRTRRNAIALGILITIIGYGFTSDRLPFASTAVADSQAMVSLYADGQKRLFPTDATTVGQVLSRTGVKLSDGDLVEPAAATKLSNGQFNINVYRARPVMVVDGARALRFSSASQSPRRLAMAAGLTVYPEDEYKTEIITDIVGSEALGVKVSLQRATPMTVKADGRARTVRTQAKTVGEAIKSAGIALGAKDSLSVPLTAPVGEDAAVTITRVSEAVVPVTEAIARPVKTTADPDLPKGQTKVLAEGSDGEKTVNYRIHYKDGVETAREPLEVLKKTEPVAKSLVVGTKVFFSGSVEYWRPQVEAAATENGLDPNMMLRIMACESKGNATVVSNFIVNGEHPTGLFQFLPATWHSHGGTDANILDGPTQIRVAARVMATEGTRAWACQ